MTVSITHAKVSGKPAGSDPDRIYGTHWDANHTVPIATQAQAEAGESEEVLMTPLAVSQFYDANAGSGVTTDGTQTLTNKTIALGSNTISGTVAEFNTALTDGNFATIAGTETLTNKTLTSPAITTPTGIVKGDVGLGNVDNTSDANKPVSTAQQTALDLKANLAGPTFTGVPAAPTAAANTNTTQIATTAYVQTELTDLANGVSASFDTLAEIATDLGLKNVKTANLSDVANAATAFGNIKQAASTTATGVTELAVASEFRANTAGNLSLTPAEVWSSAAEVTLTDAATIAVDMSTFLNAVVTLTTSRALGNPTNEKVGQSGVIRVVQPAGGGCTLSYGTDWEFAGGTAPVLSTAANAQDLLFYHVVAADRVYATLTKAIA